MSKIILFKEMLYPAKVDVCFETEHAIISEGYKQLERGSNIYEDTYTRESKEYRVVEADNEDDYIIIELAAI